MISVSIIIPVYNAEKYLRECLDSVKRQTLKDIEIICVDDGSTDSTKDILEHYTDNDNRISIVHQVNSGAGRARNVGIKRAKGQYVVFLDADDYFYDINALEKMYFACKKHKVQISGSFRKSLRENKIVDELVFNKVDMPVEPNKIYEYKDVQCDYHYQSFMFERKFLLDQKIEFPLYRRFQDPPFFVKAMYKAQRFYLLDTYLYCYRVPDVLHRFDSDKTLDLIRGLRDNLEFAIENELDILFENTLWRLEYEYASIIYRNISNKNMCILKELVAINDMVCKQRKDASYIIKPLRQMLSIVEGYALNYEKGLLDRILNSAGIYVYGAGKLAKCFLEYLEEKQVKDKVCKVIVSSVGENEDVVDGIQVSELKDCVMHFDEKIFVAVGALYQKEIEDVLLAMKIVNYELLDVEFLNMLEKKYKEIYNIY